ncbi:hypothetical protein HYE26_03975 [Mycoplasmopsis bovis]|nr:hypothetical protein HYE26_03975 [Mycoplasmopsis bovis]
MRWRWWSRNSKGQKSRYRAKSPQQGTGAVNQATRYRAAKADNKVQEHLKHTKGTEHLKHHNKVQEHLKHHNQVQEHLKHYKRYRAPKSLN